MHVRYIAFQEHSGGVEHYFFECRIWRYRGGWVERIESQLGRYAQPGDELTTAIRRLRTASVRPGEPDDYGPELPWRVVSVHRARRQFPHLLAVEPFEEAA